MAEVTKSRRKPPATNPEERQNQLIAMAYDLVEQRLRDGTATSQETTTFIKMGSSREHLELERLRQENNLLRAKADALDSSRRMEELYNNAVNAMRSYSGTQDEDEEFGDD